MKLFQHIDILIGGTSPHKVGEEGAAMWQALQKAEVEAAPEKCQGPSREVQFLGTWWIASSVAVPLDALSEIE